MIFIQAVATLICTMNMLMGVDNKAMVFHVPDSLA
jgi:hypothetical protein